MSKKIAISSPEDAFKDWDVNFGVPVLDGKIHRKDSFWYVGVITDKNVSLITIGDWRTGDKAHYFTTNADRTERYIPLFNSSRKAEENERAARFAYFKWKNAHPLSHSVYLDQKCVFKNVFHNLRYDRERNGLIVPSYDIQGKFWGSQIIYEDGEKFWFKRQKIQGCHHFVSGILPTGSGKTILVTEGYATACSLQLATKLPVCSAFFAGNLLHVAKSLKDKWPSHRYVICADNDWKTKGNPGIRFAMQAYLEYGDDIIWPPYSWTDGTGTDFNDVHCIHGLDMLKRLLGESHDIQTAIGKG